MIKLIQKLLSPHLFMLCGLSISLFFWAIPPLTFAGKGFNYTNAITITGWTVLLVWYSLIFISSFTGHRIGMALGSKRVIRSRMPLTSPFYYRLLVVFAVIGVTFTYFSIVEKIGVSSAIAVSSEFSANTLKEALYENYKRGVLSLRYLAILAFGVGLFRFLAFREWGFWLFLSFASLFGTAFVASRLSLIWAILIGMGMYVFYNRRKRQFTRKLAVSVSSIVIGLLIVFTVTRTFNTYKSVGIENVGLATLGEVQRYLASPFQGAITVASNMDSVDDLLDAYAISGIDTSLTTNSAFFQMFVQFQEWSFLVMPCIVFIASLVMGILSCERDNYFLLGYFVLLYPFAEIWRGNIFYAGITLVVIAFGIILPLFLNPFIGSYEKRINHRL
jgi:hypothetical protein